MNKLVFALIAIFSMLSGLAAVSGYVSGSEAIVQSPILLSLNFGTVFPGQTVIESVTISSQDSSDYILTLLPPTEAGRSDIRPLLSVWKDPAETDTDGIISGAPDYLGFGSFTSPNDLSDKWMVTLTVPDITLPNDTGTDYGCVLSIVPIVLPPPIPSEDLILRPISEGDYTLFDSPVEGSHWSMVDDIGNNDGVLTYVDDVTDNRIDLYRIENSQLSSGTPINKVTLFAAIKGDEIDRTNGFFGLKSGPNVYWGTRKSNLPLNYTYFSTVYTQDPATGLGWTVEAINSLQVGFFVDDSSGSGLNSTQIYVVVDITP